MSLPSFRTSEVIDLRSQQMIQHVDGRGEQNTLIGLKAFHPKTRARYVFPTSGSPMSTRLVPRRRNVRSSKRRMRFLACTRLLLRRKTDAFVPGCDCSREHFERR